MLGYKNTYLTPEEILQKISYITTDNILSMVILGCVIFLVISFILYLFPILLMMYKQIKKQRQSTKRKLMIKQIAMQRAIEEEIEKEL